MKVGSRKRGRLPVGRNVDGKRNAQKSNSLATGEHDRARNLTRETELVSLKGVGSILWKSSLAFGLLFSLVFFGNLVRK